MSHFCVLIFPSGIFFESLMKRGAARGRSRSTDFGVGRSPPPPPPSCSDISQPNLVGVHQDKKGVSVHDFLLRNKSLADQLTVSQFDTATAEIVATEKLLPWQKPPCSPTFQPVRAACARIRAGRMAGSKETAVRPSVGGLMDVVVTPIRGAG